MLRGCEANRKSGVILAMYHRLKWLIRLWAQEISTQTFMMAWFAVWCSGTVIHRMNEVTLRWARLVLGWVTVFGRVYHLSM